MVRLLRSGGARALRASLVALIGLSVASPSRADAPLRTDNADVPEPGNCKVEAWYQGSSAARAFVAAPACVPFSKLELGAAYVRSRNDAGEWANNVGLQSKIALLERTDQAPYAIATTLSIARDTGEPRGRSAFQQAAINVPASLYGLDDALRLDMNVGVTWRTGASRLATWGAAVEYDAGPITWLAETYRQEAGNARYNLGARYNVDESFSVYASADRRFGSDADGWLWTVGVKLESAAFLK